MTDVPNTKIAIVGLWHLGSLYSACFAELGFQVIGIDESNDVIENLSRGVPPVSEPELNELLKKNIAENRLSFSSNFSSVQSCDYAIIALDTPVDAKDNLDLTPIFKLARKLAPFLPGKCQVIVSSQVPVGTCEKIAKMMKIRDPNQIAYIPENLRLGNAIESFFNPTRIVVGSDSGEAIQRCTQLFTNVGAEIISMYLRSAEMVKHALNSYLAMCVSFGNEVSSLSNALGADSLEVIKAVMKDPRVSPKAPLIPGLPYSGGTLARDIGTLRNIGKQHKVSTFVLDGVSKANENRKHVIVQSVKKKIKKGSKIAVLGLTYKPGTNTLRRSLALEISKILKGSGYAISAFDPAIKELPKGSSARICNNLYYALHEANLAIIFTGWKEFENLDYTRVKQELAQPLIIDLPHILSKEKAEEVGLKIIEV
ncbi:MAG: nucleotide sugar dehydrogenase [Nitrososphaerales archaeon]